MGKQRQQQSTVELYPYDFVIVQSDGEFYRFKDKNIVIYAERDTALKDSKTMPGSKVKSSTALSRRGRKELRRNIIEFLKPPF